MIPPFLGTPLGPGLGTFGGVAIPQQEGVAGGGGADPGPESGGTSPAGQDPSILIKDPRQELNQSPEGAFTVSDTFTSNFTRLSSVATGTQAITGVGFKPKAVLFLMIVAGEGSASWGFDNSVTASCILTPNAGTGTAGIFDSSGTYSIIYQKVGDATMTYQGNISSLDVDGFTFSWTRVGLPTNTLTIRYVAFR